MAVVWLNTLFFRFLYLFFTSSKSTLNFDQRCHIIGTFASHRLKNPEYNLQQRRVKIMLQFNFGSNDGNEFNATLKLDSIEGNQMLRTRFSNSANKE